MSIATTRQKWVGFEVAIADEIAKRNDLKVVRIPVTNKTRIAFIQQGRIDISVATRTHKRERDKSIDFAITYVFGAQKMPAKKGQFKEPKDFVGKKITTLFTDTSLAYVIEVLEPTFVARGQNNRLMVYSFEIYLTVAFLYFVCCYSMSLVAGRLERKLNPERLRLQM